MYELFCNQANDSRTCDPWVAQDFEVNITKASLLCPHCLPDCNHVTYSSTTTSAAFRFRDIECFVNILPQAMRLPQSELEPTMRCQLNINLTSEVGTHFKSDVRKQWRRHCGICQRLAKSNEKRIPYGIHGVPRDSRFSDRGFQRS